MEFVVDHNNRRGAATGETFHEINRDLAIGRDFAEVSMKLFLKGRAGLITTKQSAGKRAADLNVSTTDRLLPEHRVKRDHFEHVDRLQLELGGDPFTGVWREMSDILLDEVQQRERGAPLRRVMRNYLVDLGECFGLEIHRAGFAEKLNDRTRP